MSDSEICSTTGVSIGDALLVCPIVEEGGRSRQVTLPKGRWYNFWDDGVIEGEQQVSLEAPLERIPLLVRAGSMIPMEQGNELMLHIYPPVEGSSISSLYSDANDGYGESRLDKFRILRSENNLEITWEEQGNYPFPYAGVKLHLHGMKLQQAWVDDAEVACQEQIIECDRLRRCALRHRFHKLRIQGEFADILP